MPLPALSSLPLPSEGPAEAHPARGEARGSQLRKAVPGGGSGSPWRWDGGQRGCAAALALPSGGQSARLVPLKERSPNGIDDGGREDGPAGSGAARGAPLLSALKPSRPLAAPRPGQRNPSRGGAVISSPLSVPVFTTTCCFSHAFTAVVDVAFRNNIQILLKIPLCPRVEKREQGTGEAEGGEGGERKNNEKTLPKTNRGSRQQSVCLYTARTHTL